MTTMAHAASTASFRAISSTLSSACCTSAMFALEPRGSPLELQRTGRAPAQQLIPVVAGSAIDLGGHDIRSRAVPARGRGLALPAQTGRLRPVGFAGAISTRQDTSTKDHNGREQCEQNENSCGHDGQPRWIDASQDSNTRRMPSKKYAAASGPFFHKISRPLPIACAYCPYFVFTAWAAARRSAAWGVVRCAGYPDAHGGEAKCCARELA